MPSHICLGWDLSALLAAATRLLGWSAFVPSPPPAQVVVARNSEMRAIAG